LGTFLDQDKQLQENSEVGELPLPVEVRREFGGAMVAIAVLSRAFPSNRARDGRVRDYWRSDDQIIASRVQDEAARVGELTPEDNATLNEMREAGQRPGIQGQKSAGRHIASLRNWLLAAAALITVEVAIPSYVSKSLRMQALGEFLVRIEDNVVGLVSDMPADLAAAVRHALDESKTTFGLAPQKNPARREEETETDDGIENDEVIRLILSGAKVPEHLIKKTKKVNFTFTDISDLSSILQLKNLNQIFLNRTKVSDISPLSTLKNLTFLSVDHTAVTDLSPVSSFQELTALSFEGTKISDLSPLQNLKKNF
jgi:hypothetical protein